MRVMDLSNRPLPLVVEIDASPAYELVASLWTYGESTSNHHDPASFQLGASWLDDVRDRASPALRAGIDEISGGHGQFWLFLLGHIYECPPPRNIAAFLAHLEATEAAELRLWLLEGCDACEGLSRETIRQVAQGDRTAVEQYLAKMASTDDEHNQGLIRAAQLALDPETAKQQLTDILRRWYEEVFRRQEVEVEEILARDLEAKRKLLRGHTPDQMIEIATNGLRYERDSGIKRVVLIPSIVIRPWVLITNHHDTKIFCYSVSEESLAPAANRVPPRLITLFKALADERRLAALRILATRSPTLQELADELGVGKSLMHHHMATLRAAGLVRITLSAEKRYELRSGTFAGMQGLLDAFLQGQPGEPADTCTPTTARRD